MNYINNSNLKINNVIEKLEVLNPLNSLKRGYSIVKKDGKSIKDVKNLKENDIINIELNNGIIKSTVNQIEMR